MIDIRPYAYTFPHIRFLRIMVTTCLHLVCMSKITVRLLSKIRQVKNGAPDRTRTCIRLSPLRS